MYATKSVLPETASFSPEMIHHEYREKSSTENLTNFAYPLASNIEARNVTSRFKESTSQPVRRLFVEATRRVICDHGIDKHWNLVRRRDLSGKKTIMSICFFKIRRSPDDSIIKKKFCLCAHGGMQKWEVNYWEI